MHYMKLNPDEREEFMQVLSDMPAFLQDAFGELTAERERSRAADGTWSPVEQVWHLADLEREGFGERIRRLLSEREPHLADFDGEKVAEERNYRARSFRAGLAAFTDARQRNIATLRSLEGETWFLSGTQEGVGKVSLCDIPAFMSQHDAAHRAEIEEWRKSALR